MFHKFVRTDRIDSIRREDTNSGDLQVSHAGLTMCDTRMNLCHDYIEGALKQHTFLSSMSRSPKWKEFLNDRKSTEKSKWENVLWRCLDNER